MGQNNYSAILGEEIIKVAHSNENIDTQELAKNLRECLAFLNQSIYTRDFILCINESIVVCYEEEELSEKDSNSYRKVKKLSANGDLYKVVVLDHKDLLGHLIKLEPTDFFKELELVKKYKENLKPINYTEVKY